MKKHEFVAFAALGLVIVAGVFIASFVACTLMPV